ncbi:MAG: stalk domain-containing protein [Vulcanibacillus sp.]
MKSYRYQLIKEENIYTLVIHLNHLNEFADEANISEQNTNTKLIEDIKLFAIKTFPNIKISFVKIMIGAVVIFTIPLSSVALAETSYTVQSGDSLWKIATNYDITVSKLKSYNNLSSDMIYIGQKLKIPSSDNINITINGKSVTMIPEAFIIDGVTYVPVRAFSELLGASVWWNSESNTIGIEREDTKIAFIAGSSKARINGVQTSIQPSRYINNTTYVPIRFITDAFGLYVSWDDKTKAINITEQKLTVTYINHTVKQGDNLWNLSIYYGIPLSELMAVNNLGESSTLFIGQNITVPVHHIPIKSTVSDKYGELLDWWTEAQYVFTINEVAKVTDFQTGKTFYVERTIGANHADCEPLTASDSAIIKEIWGGTYSWSSRAVIIEVDGRKIAASMSSMPHDIQYITNNNFNGHFDIHFLNSTRHIDGLVDESHQVQIKIAAGI